VKANRPHPDAVLRPAGGFTVIELVIAIAVSAIVVITIGSVLSRVSQTRDIARAHLDAVSRANAALDALRSDLASVIRDEDLYNSRVLLLDGTGYSTLGPTDRDEVLVYNNRLRPMRRDDYQGEGGEYESQYRLDANDGVLWMRRDAVPDQNGEGGGMALPVVDGVVGISIEAYDGEAWYPDWDSDVMGLPWALRVSVTAVGGELDDPDRVPRSVTLRTQIPIDRVVPPPQLTEEEEAAAGDDAAAGADDAAANGDAASGAGQTGGAASGVGGGAPVGPGMGGPGMGGSGMGGGGGSIGGGGGGDAVGGPGGGGATVGGPKPPVGTSSGRRRGGYINPGSGPGTGASRGSRG
jgi:type II secretion system protein J